MPGPDASLVRVAQAALKAPAAAPVQPVSPSSGSVSNFSDALSAAEKAQAALSQSGPSAQAAASTSAAGSEAQSRARHALGLDHARSLAATDGDAVLNGLTKMRTLFNEKLSDLAAATADGSSTEGLFRAQAATATFSEWMDVASRLVGKSSQTLMTLLKGQ